MLFSWRNSNPVTAPTSCPDNQHNGGSGTLPLLTRRRRLYFWLILMNSMIFPLSISSETIETGGGVKMTPTNGKMLSCRSHFHPTTSLARSFGSSLNNYLVASGAHQLTLCSFSGSAAAVPLRTFIETGRPLKVPLYTSEEPPVANGASSRSIGVGSSTIEGRRMPKVPHKFRRYLRYCVCLCMGRPPLSRAWMYSQGLTQSGQSFYGIAHRTKPICKLLCVLFFRTTLDTSPIFPKESDEFRLPWFQLNRITC